LLYKVSIKILLEKLALRQQLQQRHDALTSL